MKFGEYLNTEKDPEWQHFYLDYDQLKGMIKELEEIHLAVPNESSKVTSLSVPRPTNAAGMPDHSRITQEAFYGFLEQEMRKIEQFTKKQVEDVRKTLGDVETQINLSLVGIDEATAHKLKKVVEKAGEDFLKLEKFVNMNFTGFHKILKKHDRRLPNPCRAFYLARLHDQSWVRGDYSDVIVTMSRLYSKLRGDEEKEAKDDAKQDFVRSTRKYWVHTEDISEIKYHVLQHLPVFLQNTMAGETDSQLINSVYLDNYSMELYRGRLAKSPGAIALRFRWYGTGTPDTIFVERKTHRDSWTGEVSVKERFIIKENQVLDLLQGKFDLEAEMQRLRKKGKSEEDIKAWHLLASEVVQAINSKQLIPTMRTQYMRTAFQIPFDATVRISLDTNLCMISERTKETISGKRWYRDPNVVVPLNEITRFPHGVLEIKLQLEDESKTPLWVSELLRSGKLLEVHKYSKFIHGCAVLLGDEVQDVPYWIDDASLKESIVKSGAQKILEDSTGANQYYHHLLPHDTDGQIKPKPKEKPSEFYQPTNEVWTEENTCCDFEDTTCCEWAGSMRVDHITMQKVEPKLFFANERTFISWLHMAVIMYSAATSILAFTNNKGQGHLFALVLLPIALIFIIYALRTYLIRNEKIKGRDSNRWDDPYGPILLTSLVVVALTIQFFLKVRELSLKQ